MTTPTRKRVLSNSRSGASSGVSTPVMEKTDSVVNLTKPSLYGIYHDNLFVDLNKEDNYPAVQTPPKQPEATGAPEALPHLAVPVLVAKIATLAVAAFLYNSLTTHIHNQHIETLSGFKPLLVTNKVLANFVTSLKPSSLLRCLVPEPVDAVVSLTAEGMVMGLMHPFMDRVLPGPLTKRLLTSNPNRRRTAPAALFHDLMRLVVTFLGISYAVRKVEWSSSLQVLIVWLLLNPGLWLLLDGTISGFISSVVVAALACLGVYVQSYDAIHSFLNSVLLDQEDFYAIWLWTGSFFFCGLILFGKLGRALFVH